MTVFWFAFCMVPSAEFVEGFRLNRCYHWEKAVCEAVFDECFEGRVATPARRQPSTQY